MGIGGGDPTAPRHGPYAATVTDGMFACEGERMAQACAGTLALAVGTATAMAVESQVLLPAGAVDPNAAMGPEGGAGGRDNGNGR
mgnify:CR=1 FL=1